jgi:outer membrane protein assembly factor BamB
MKNLIIKNSKTSKISALFTVLIAACLSASCSTFFEKDNTPNPSPLTDYKAEISPRLLWATNASPGALGKDYLKMNPAVDATSVYVAGTNGGVTSFDKKTGRRNWQSFVSSALSSGPDVGDGIVVVGGQHGKIIALAKSDGRELWTTSLPGEVIAAPAVGDGYVVVKAVDGDTRGLSVKDGHEIWAHKQTEPNLILRGSSAALIRDREVIVGYANGNLAKLGLSSGQLLWTQMAAIPEGAFAIQRMIDIDADPIVFQHHIYVATYQGRISSLNWSSGSILWTHDISSYTGMAADNNAVYISDATGLVWAFDADSGNVHWQQNNLKYRILSAPAALGNYVVVGDAQGYLHWLNKGDGHLAARISLDAPIYASPIAENNVLYVLANNGYLAAYTLR